MEIFKNLIMVASLATFSIATYAQTPPQTLPKIWVKQTIKPKINPDVSGELPYFPDKKWQFLNKQLHTWLTKNFDNKDAKTSDDALITTVEPIYQDNKVLSLAINLQISDYTSRYLTEYYTLDLPHHRLLTLSEYLKRKNIRYPTVQQAMKHYLQPCIERENEKNQVFPEYCDDMSLEYLIGTQESLDDGFYMPEDRQFFIAGKDKLGVAFNSNKMTASFVYDEKTGEVKLLEKSF